MAISGDMTPEQYEILFGETPPTMTTIAFAPPAQMQERRDWRVWRRMSRAIQFGVLFLALVVGVVLLGLAANSLINTAAATG